ncbi:MAG: efflux RND transporter periplasmic adaptor subunit [Pseudohongiellaceae bacterium]
MDSKQRKLPTLVALGIVAAVSLWMLSGLGSEPAANAGADGAPVASSGLASGLPRVRASTHVAHEISREVLINGRTGPDRRVELRAEAEGRVDRILVERGEAVGAGQLLFVLDSRDRDARLAEASSLVQQREIEYAAIQNLRGQKFSTEIQSAEALARLDAARAVRKGMELEIANASIEAPFAGVVQERQIEVGDFVRVGDSLAEFVDLDPIIITGNVNEREIGHIRMGGRGTAVLVDGREVQGEVRYISRVADAATRSFLVELAVPNPDNAIRAGVTARLRLYADSVRVHTLSSALLSLADDGTVGVKVVDERSIVRFYPVQIVGSTQEGLHVTGLPDSIQLITVGQGFVSEGQQVEAQPLSLDEGAQQ